MVPLPDTSTKPDPPDFCRGERTHASHHNNDQDMGETKLSPQLSSLPDRPVLSSGH